VTANIFQYRQKRRIPGNRQCMPHFASVYRHFMSHFTSDRYKSTFIPFFDLRRMLLQSYPHTCPNVWNCVSTCVSDHVSPCLILGMPNAVTVYSRTHALDLTHINGNKKRIGVCPVLQYRNSRSNFSPSVRESLLYEQDRLGGGPCNSTLTSFWCQ
jgi:hypothetical protein